MRRLEAAQDILERASELGASCMRGIGVLCEESPSFADTIESIASFFNDHAQKIFVLTCVVSFFCGPLIWASGIALGALTARIRPGQVFEPPHLFCTENRLGYGCALLLLAYFILKATAYTLSCGFCIGNHLYNVRYRILDSVTSRS